MSNAGSRIEPVMRAIYRHEDIFATKVLSDAATPVGHGRMLCARGHAQAHGPGQDRIKASRSGLMTSAWVVSMPCGYPSYALSDPFSSRSTARGTELPNGTI